MTQSPALVADAKMISLVYEIRPEGATFTPAITLTMRFDPHTLPADVKVSDLYIARWDGTKWQPLESTVNEAAHTVSAQISGFSQFAVIGKPTPPPPPAPAKFTVSDVIVTPSTCKPDEEVTIAATVSNTGGTTGQYDVILTINGVKEDTKSVTLDAGASLQVEFTVSKSIPDNYKVDVNGITASFVVEKPVPSPVAMLTPTPTPASSVQTSRAVQWWIVGAVVGAAVLGGVIYGTVRRRRRA
jgi:hypothetical protein